MIIRVIIVTVFLKNVISDDSDLTKNTSNLSQQQQQPYKIHDLCPCLPRVFCPRVYGASFEDSKYLGEILKCEQNDHVRCCGVSASMVIGMERRIVPEHDLIPTQPSIMKIDENQKETQTDEMTTEILETTTTTHDITTTDITIQDQYDTTTSPQSDLLPTTTTTVKLMNKRQPKFIDNTMMIYPNVMSGIEKTTPQNMQKYSNEFRMFDNDTDTDLHLIFPKNDSTTEFYPDDPTTTDNVNELTTTEINAITENYDVTTISYTTMESIELTNRTDLEGQESEQKSISIDDNLATTTELIELSTAIDNDITTIENNDETTTMIMTTTTQKPRKIRKKRRRRILRIGKRINNTSTLIKDFDDRNIEDNNLENTLNSTTTTTTTTEITTPTVTEERITLQQNENDGHNTIERDHRDRRTKKDISKLTDESSSRKRYFRSRFYAISSTTEKIMTTPFTEVTTNEKDIISSESQENVPTMIIDDDHENMMMELRSIPVEATSDVVSSTIENVVVDNLNNNYTEIKKIKDDIDVAVHEVTTQKPLRGRIRFGTRIVSESPIRSTTTTTEMPTTVTPTPVLSPTKSHLSTLFVRKRKKKVHKTVVTTTIQPLTTAAIISPQPQQPNEIENKPKFALKLRNRIPPQIRQKHRFTSPDIMIAARPNVNQNSLRSALLTEISETESTRPSAAAQQQQRPALNLLRTPLTAESSAMVVEFRPSPPSQQKWSIYSVGYVPEQKLPIPSIYPIADAASSFVIPFKNEYRTDYIDNIYDTSINNNNYGDITGFGTYEQQEPLIIGPIPFSLKGKFRDGANLNYNLPYALQQPIQFS